MVKPGTSEFMIVRSHRWRPRKSSYGTMSWRLGGTRTHISLGWSVPFCRLFYNNWLMMGVVYDAPGNTFKEMYYDDCNGNQWFTRKDFKRGDPSSKLYLDNIGLMASGKMSSGCKSVIRIMVMPNFEEDLALPVYNFLHNKF